METYTRKVRDSPMSNGEWRSILSVSLPIIGKSPQYGAHAMPMQAGKDAVMLRFVGTTA